MYGLDACYLNKSKLNSLDFTINRLFMKLFKTNNLDIVNYCQHCFGFEMPSELWAKRITKLNEKKSLIVLTRLWLDSAKFEVNFVNNIISQDY